jgi:hypothetical protein
MKLQCGDEVKGREGKKKRNEGRIQQRNKKMLYGHRQHLRVASGTTAPGPALEGVPHFMPKVVYKQEKFV